jgi:hypothetical protein
MSLDAGAIATGIAALTVTGISIKDITAIPEQVQPRDCPILFPSPNGWMAGGNGEPSNGPATFGSPTGRMWVFNRVLNYVYLHSSIGAGRGLIDNIPGMSDNVDAIITKLLELDLAQVDIQNISIGAFGELNDPGGNSFFGTTIAVTVREKVNP